LKYDIIILKINEFCTRGVRVVSVYTRAAKT